MYWWKLPLVLKTINADQSNGKFTFFVKDPMDDPPMSWIP